MEEIKEKIIELLKQFIDWLKEQKAEEFSPGQSWFFRGALIVSFLAILISGIILIYRYKKSSNPDLGSSLRWFLLWNIAAAAIMFLPVYWLTYKIEITECRTADGIHTVVRSLLLSVHHSMRLMVMDGEFDFIRDQTEGLPHALRWFFTLHAAVLYFSVPFTFYSSIILFFFKFAWGDIQFFIHKRFPVFIFSCLNDESKAMAESILSGQDSKSRKKKLMIVFCNVTNVSNDENRREELNRLSHELSGKRAYIVFKKKAVNELEINRFKNDITYFLMDTDERINLQDVSELSEKLNKTAAKSRSRYVKLADNRSVRVLVYASSPGSGPIIDAISRNRSMSKELVKKLSSAISELLNAGEKADAVKPVVKEIIKDFPMPDETLRALNWSIDDTYAWMSEQKSEESVNEAAVLEKAKEKILDAATRNLVVPANAVECLKNTIDELSKHDKERAYRAKMLNIIRKTVSDNSLYLSFPFSIMRIDKKTQLALSIVKDMLTDQPKPDKDAHEGESTLTVTMIGLGGIGEEILENLLWMGQRYRRHLVVNVFDATGPKLGANPDAAHNPLYDRLVSKWPELISTNREWQNCKDAHPDTEADYDVRFFLGTDCFSNRFRSLFDAGSPCKARLLESDAVICSLGDDEKSLQAAIMMRRLFVGKAVEAGREKDPMLYSKPGIFAVIYDDLRANRVNGQVELTNHKDNPYNIKAVGSMQSQFSYKGIMDLEEDEKEAVIHHISWIFTCTDGTDSSEWSDYRAKNAESKNVSRLCNELNNYIHYDYFRRASLTKAIHKKMLDEQKAFPEKAGDHNHEKAEDFARCDICRSRITEHMRWNAYMRVNGYRYGAERDDMAKIHTDLKAWKDLSESERKKD